MEQILIASSPDVAFFAKEWDTIYLEKRIFFGSHSSPTLQPHCNVATFCQGSRFFFCGLAVMRFSRCPFK